MGKPHRAVADGKVSRRHPAGEHRPFSESQFGIIKADITLIRTDPLCNREITGNSDVGLLGCKDAVTVILVRNIIGSDKIVKLQQTVFRIVNRTAVVQNIRCIFLCNRYSRNIQTVGRLDDIARQIIGK